MAAPSSCFVADVSIPDGSSFYCGSMVHKTWRLRNNGIERWPAGTRVVSSKQNAEGFAKGLSVELGEDTCPGHTCDVSLDLKVPSTAGRHKAVFSLADPNGTRFGTIFYIDIVAVPNESECKPGGGGGGGGTKHQNNSSLLCNSLKASFVEDVTVPDGSSFGVGSKIVKTWRLRNNGQVRWPAGTQVLASESNGDFGKNLSKTLDKCPHPGATCDITMELKVPSATGEYTASFSLATQEGKRFGTRFYTQVVAIQPESKAPIRVHIKSLSGATTSLEVKAGDTIELVKMKLEEKTGTPSAKIRLLMNKQQLENHRTVGWYKIKDNTELFVLVKVAKNFQIVGKMLTGKMLHLDVSTVTTVQGLLQKIQDKEGIPPDQMRLLYNAKKITSRGATLDDLGMKDGDVVHILLKLRNIGVFGEHPEHSLGRSLLCDVKNNASEKPSLSSDDTCQLIRGIGASASADFVSSGERTILSQKQCAQLRSHLDQIHRRCIHIEKDLKVDITAGELERLLGGPAVLQRIASIFPRSDWHEIKLRRCVAHGKHINFHTDVAKRTMQVNLSDEGSYVGGRLVFVNSKGVHVPRRPAGSYTIHPQDIAHGVTRLDDGVRYGLYFLRNSST